MTENTYDIHAQPEWVELTTVEAFRERQRAPFGVIVIWDRVRDAPIAHHRECPFVSEDSFTEKVIDGAGKNGRYWWAKNSRIAAEQLGARRCGHSADPLAR
jgi:hypothetical protein